MTNTKTISKTVIAAVLAIIIAASSAAIIGSVKAGAVSYEGSAQAHQSQKSEAYQIPEKTTKLNQIAKAYYFKGTGKTAKGYDWTYKTDNTNVKIKCKYDFDTHKYTFKLVGTSYGINHFTLKYKMSDKVWVYEKMTLFVDKDKNIKRTA